MQSVVGQVGKALVALVVLDVIRQVCWLAVPTTRVARRRWFTAAQYRTIVGRAGWRCEYHFLLFGRCRATGRLHADHVHPWARGGQTDVANGQALCGFHNQLKWAWVPSVVSVWKLERRRRRYFPDSADVGVIRFGARSSQRRSSKTAFLTRVAGGRKRRRTVRVLPRRRSLSSAIGIRKRRRRRKRW